MFDKVIKKFNISYIFSKIFKDDILELRNKGNIVIKNVD